MLNYKRIFDLQLKHNFYTNGSTNDFAIVPLAETQRTLKNHGIVVRSSSGESLTGLIRVQNIDSSTPFTPVSNAKLIFLLTLETPKFLNFTDVPQRGNRDAIYYFNNVEVDSQDRSLTIGDFVAKEDRIQLFPKQFTFSIGTNETINDYEVVDVNTGITILEGVSETNQVSINLSDNPSGLYKIRTDINGALQEFTIYSLAKTQSRSVFGVVELYISDSNQITAIDEVLSSGDVRSVPVQYNIQFNRRNSFWKYKLVVRDNTALNQLFDLNLPDLATERARLKIREFTIATGDGTTTSTVNFTTPVFLEDENTIELTSDIPIPFTQAAIRNISLFIDSDDENDADTEEILVDHLPNASTDIISSVFDVDDLETENNSEIFVYV